MHGMEDQHMWEKQPPLQIHKHVNGIKQKIRHNILFKFTSYVLNKMSKIPHQRTNEKKKKSIKSTSK